MNCNTTHYRANSSSVPGDPTAGNTGVSITETDRYVLGDESYRTDVKVVNHSGSLVSGAVYRAGDCYLQDSDFGVGLHTPDGTTACQSTTGRIEGFTPITSGSHYLEAYYGNLWSAFVNSPGQQFPDSIVTSSVDNGVGLSWPLSLNDSENSTFSSISTYSPSGRLPLTTTLTADHASVSPGQTVNYTLQISNPNGQAASLNSIVNTLPAGFSYNSGSSSGLTTADPTGDGHTLTWNGPLTVPAASEGPGTAVLTFGTTAATGTGTYVDNIAADGGIFDVVPASTSVSVVGPLISNLSLSASPSNTPAGFASMNESGLNLAGAALDAGTLAGSAGPQDAPLGKNPLGKNPLGKNPLGKNPLGKNPLGKNPLGKNPLGKNNLNTTDAPLRDTPVTALIPAGQQLSNPPLLTDMPISKPGGWPSVLNTQAPLQTLTLNDAISNPAWNTLNITDIDWSATPFADFSLAAWLLGKAKPSDITSWPANTSMGPGCTTSMSFVQLQLNRCDLTAVRWDQIPLSSISGLAGTPLGHYHLDTILLSYTPLGDIPAGNASSVLTCVPGTSCPSTVIDLKTAQDAPNGGYISTAKVLSDLSGQLSGTNLPNLLPGMVDVTGYPYEAMNVSQIVAAADTGDQSSRVHYAAAMDVGCPGAVGSTMTVRLPNQDFRYVDGQFSIGAVQTPAGAPSSTDGHGALTFTVPDTVCDGGAGTTHVSLGINVVPGPTPGTYGAGLSATAPGVDPVTVTNPANNSTVNVTEGQESGNNMGSATTIQPNTLYTGTIDSSTDQDFFTIPLNATDTPPGTRVAVYLSHLTQDDDVVLYGPSASAASLHPAPLGKNPLGKNPVDDNSSCLPEDYSVQPQTLQDVAVTSGSDIAVRGFSTNRSTQEEITCAVVNEQDSGHLTVQVSGFNGAQSNQPYVLRYVVVPPPSPRACQSIPLGTGGTTGTMPASIPSTTQTLILWNAKRFGDTYGSTAETQTLQSLNQLAASPIVNGAVIPVEADPGVANAYTALNGNPCSPAAANGVVRSINGLADQLKSTYNLSDLRFIQIVGSDNIVPFARVNDLTALGNQSEYQGDARVGSTQDNPISRAFAQGFLLTDDPYGSFSPIPWNGNQLYVPNVSTGRLVETPTEIQNQITTFLNSSGRLTLSSSLVTGYDFTSDSATAIKSALATNLGYTGAGLISDTWDDAALKASLNAAPRAISMNGHFDQYRAQTAAGAILSTSQYLATAVPNQALLFTLGCNAGVSFPDTWVTAPATLDWAQAQSQKRGELVGNTGFGYGDDTTIAFSERLMLLYAQNLNGTMSAGQALALAKSQYYAGLSALGSYDIKAMEESTFYGIPMYRIGANGVIAGGTPPAPQPARAGHTLVTPGALTSDGDTGLSTVNIQVPNFIDPANDQRDGTPTSNHYFVGPNTQVSQYRPIEPVSEPINMTKSGQTLHDALVTSLSTQDINGFNPVMSVPTLDNSNDQPEPLVNNVVFPTDFVSTSTLQGPFGRQDFLVIDGGRYVANPDTPGQGTQRIYTAENVRAFYSGSNDFTRPQYQSLNAVANGNGTTFTAVMAPDQAGDLPIAVYVLYKPSGSDTFRLTSLSPSSDHSTWSGPPVSGAVDEYVAQAVDQNGNVGVSTFKGGAPLQQNQIPGSVRIGYADANAPYSSTGSFKDHTTVSISGGQTGETFSAVLDGQSQTGSSVRVDTDGVHEVDYVGSQGTKATVFVPVDAVGPTFGACPDIGQPLLNTGTKTVTITAADNGGVNAASSTLTQSFSTSTVGTKTVTFTAVDGFGHQSTKSCPYQVIYKFTGFQQPIDNGITNVAKSGSTIPVKWRITDGLGNAISDPANFSSLDSVKVTLGTCTSSPTDAIETYSSGSGLQYNGDGNWQLNWKTPANYAGTCRTMTVTLNDLTKHTAAFQFK